MVKILGKAKFDRLLTLEALFIAEIRPTCEATVMPRRRGEVASYNYNLVVMNQFYSHIF